MPRSLRIVSDCPLPDRSILRRRYRVGDPGHGKVCHHTMRHRITSFQLLLRPEKTARDSRRDCKETFSGGWRGLPSRPFGTVVTADHSERRAGYLCIKGAPPAPAGVVKGSVAVDHLAPYSRSIYGRRQAKQLGENVCRVLANLRQPHARCAHGVSDIFGTTP